jgi:hypothetical protein
MEIEQLAGLGLPGCQGALWLCLGVMSGGLGAPAALPLGDPELKVKWLA